MKQAARNNIGAIEERSLRLEREINRIKTILSGRDDILRVILFGSFAQGRTDAFSDLDIIIIQESGKRFMDRLDEMYRLLSPTVACDILVYTPREFERLQKESSFVSHAVSTGTVLHAA